MFSNAIEGKLQFVVSGFADLLGALGVLVVKHMVGAQLLHKIEVVRRCGCVDFCARELCELDRKCSCGGRSPVDQNRCGFRDFGGWQG